MLMTTSFDRKIILSGLRLRFSSECVSVPLKLARVLNLFLGWTVVGWVISLVWAVTKDATQLSADSQSLNASASEMKACPDCAETVKAAAKKCRFCGHQFQS
jgi:Uncharacterised protein family UPF0547/Superinfection immunity protein